jgi:hypothetical protein
MWSGGLISCQFSEEALIIWVLWLLLSNLFSQLARSLLLCRIRTWGGLLIILIIPLTCFTGYSWFSRPDPSWQIFVSATMTSQDHLTYLCMSCFRYSAFNSRRACWMSLYRIRQKPVLSCTNTPSVDLHLIWKPKLCLYSHCFPWDQFINKSLL